VFIPNEKTIKLLLYKGVANATPSPESILHVNKKDILLVLYFLSSSRVLLLFLIYLEGLTKILIWFLFFVNASKPSDTISSKPIYFVTKSNALIWLLAMS
jgi:hypothetical protein